MAELRLVAGLGNPGLQYNGTRHNVGFMVIDYLAGKKGVTFSRSAAWGSELGKWGDILLIKPLSYMNRTGEVIGRFAHYFKIQPEEILVAVDDVALPLGRLRLRQAGSDGSQVLTYQVNTENGKEVSRTLLQTVVTVQAVPKIIARGLAVSIPADKQSVMRQAGIADDRTGRQTAGHV